MKLNCVVVDDSSIQRMIIAKLVNNHPNLHLVGDFSNAIEAKNCMSVHTVDLIFLDIEMPVISGFDFLDGLMGLQNLYNLFDDSQFVCMPVGFGIVNSQMIQAVNANFSAGMNDVIVVHDNANVNDVAFLVVEKSQITWFAFLDKT